MRRVAALLAAGLVVVAEPVAAQVPSEMVSVRMMPPTYAETASTSALRRFDRPSESAEVAYRFLADKTRLIATPGAPLEVSYTAADGGVVLWQLRTGALRRGRWTIEEQRWPLVANGETVRTRSRSSVCFDYSSGLPKILPPEWRRERSCLPLWFLRRTAKDRKTGDVLGLAEGEPPTRPARREIRNLADLLRGAGERGRDERKDR